MAVIEASVSFSNLRPSMEEKIDISDAPVGTVLRGNVTPKARHVTVTAEDTVEWVWDASSGWPERVESFHKEEINQMPQTLPGAIKVRWGLKPFPGIVTIRQDLFYTPVPELVTDPRGLLRYDDTLLAPSDEDLELAHDLAGFSSDEEGEVSRRWFERIVEQIDRKIPPGAAVKGFVDTVAITGLGLSLKDKDRRPLVAAMQGLLGASIGNTIGSVVDHRLASHGSVEFTPGTTRVLKMANALEAGLRPDRFNAMHTVHHATADTPDDPHSPLYKGRWKVFFGIADISKQFAQDHPDIIATQQESPVTRKTPLDTPLVTALGVAGTHWAMGEVLRQPLKYRAISAAIHIVGMKVSGGTFTGDAHPNGAPLDFGFGPGTSIVMGGETDHARHHKEPYNPRHANVDPGYALIQVLKRFGLANIPASELIEKNK